MSIPRASGRVAVQGVAPCGSIFRRYQEYEAMRACDKYIYGVILNSARHE